MKGTISLPPVLSDKLSGFRRRVWVVKLAEGILAAIFGLGVSYLLVLGLDRFFETPALLRGLFLMAGAAVPGLGLPLKWHRWVWRQRRLEDAARLLRWKFPRLGDQLLGIVELAKQDAATGRSERLVMAAMDQAEGAVTALDFSDAVPRAHHWRWGFAAIGACALIVTGFVAMNEAARNSLARWLMPWQDVERFTFARVQDLPDPLIVPLAEPFMLPVTLSEDTRWKPDSASGRIADQGKVTSEREETHYALKFPPQKEDTEVFVKVGDVRETLKVQPRPRPELTALNVHLKLPDYLRYETEPVLEVRGGAVPVVTGAKATFEAIASRELAEASIDGKPVKKEGRRLISEPLEFPDAREVGFEWKDTLGLTPQAPLVLKVHPVDDEAPRLVARRESLEQVVLESEVVAFDVSANDDFGVRRVGLEWRSVDNDFAPGAVKVESSKITAAGAPETRQLDTRATFCAQREGIEPQTVEVRAWAEDYAPDRERSRSAAFVMHVLSPDDHAIWVTQQMARWLEAAKETYEREQQLHATNKELRSIDAAELDRPENRRRIAMQASAENANGVRLSSLTDSGRNLVNQATKNPEFDAKRLESWAKMLRSLQDIAANRMPSVADLLKQSADAKADAKLANAGNSSPNQPSNLQPSAEPSDGKSGEAKESGPTITQGPSSPASGAPGDTDASEDGKDPAPSIALNESTMLEQGDKSEAPLQSGKPSAPSLGLPTNSLAGPPSDAACPPPQSTAQQRLDDGLQEQRDLLAEFAKVSDQLDEILASLEASTFVKRFKAASRHQTQLASNLSQKTLDAFGIVREFPDSAIGNIEEKDDPESNAENSEVEKGTEDLESARNDLQEEKDNNKDKAEEEQESEATEPAALAKEEEMELPFVTTFAPVAATFAKDESQIVKLILTDMQAYYQRRPDLHFRRVIKEMRGTRVIQELARVGARAEDNYSGNAIHAAELWADTMDRWAEEMVAVGDAFC